MKKKLFSMETILWKRYFSKKGHSARTLEHFKRESI